MRGRLPDVRALLRGRRYLFRSPEAVFTAIWRSGHWARATPGGSRSGPGSSSDAARRLVIGLPPLLARLGARSLLDVPCGDFAWMKDVDRTGFDYLGGDVVAPLVAENEARHGATGARFAVLDVTRDPLPRADVVLCRDALVHFSLRLAGEALARIRESGSDWLLATTFPGLPANENVVTGGWRPLDLTKPPFSLPPPTESIFEQSDPAGRLPDKHLGLWRVKDLPAPTPGGSRAWRPWR